MEKYFKLYLRSENIIYSDSQLSICSCDSLESRQQKCNGPQNIKIPYGSNGRPNTSTRLWLNTVKGWIFIEKANGYGFSLHQFSRRSRSQWWSVRGGSAITSLKGTCPVAHVCSSYSQFMGFAALHGHHQTLFTSSSPGTFFYVYKAAGILSFNYVVIPSTGILYCGLFIPFYCRCLFLIFNQKILKIYIQHLKFYPVEQYLVSVQNLLNFSFE